jgi:multiple sugar transport system permease protein
VVPTEFCLGFLLALLFDRELPGLGFIRSLLMIPIIFTPVVAALSWKLLLNAHFGLINNLLNLINITGPDWLGSRSVALWSVMIVDIWQWTPFMFLILFAGIRTLPVEPFESSMIDGASTFQQFRYLTLPMLKYIMLVAIILRFVDAVRVFDIPFVLTHGGPALGSDLFSLLIYRHAFKFFEIGSAAALSLSFLITVLVIVIIYFQLAKLKF